MQTLATGSKKYEKERNTKQNINFPNLRLRVDAYPSSQLAERIY